MQRIGGGIAVLAVVAFVFALTQLGGGAGDKGPLPAVPPKTEPAPGAPTINSLRDVDPFKYAPDRDAEFLERGREGLAHVLYAKSPGGIVPSAERTTRWRPLIDAAARRHGVDPATIEAIVLLESAGRPDVEANGTPDSAVGLAQILPGTATSLLGMHVDLGQSLRIHKRLVRETRIATRARKRRTRDRATQTIRRLVALRPKVDQRYDPKASLEGAARYLEFAQGKLGRPDLAIASYHMGVGNLQTVIDTYVSPHPRMSDSAATVARYGITYPRLFFDSTPLRNPKAYRKLAGFGDDSRYYFFRVEAAREILAESRSKKGLAKLEETAALQTSKASAEDLLRPQSEYKPYKDATALRKAYRDGDLVALPDEPRRLGFRIDPGMGSLAKQIHERKPLFRGLRPDSLAVLLYLTTQVRAIAGGSHLIVTSTVRDQKYQQALVGINIQATREFSLHTVGYAFDIERNFKTRAEANATVAVLERLRALNVIDWVYEPAALHVTAGPRAHELLPFLDKLIERP
jgi:soluble lytic murein transglycosylase-like protein